MKVFISWSGTRSKLLARALKELLPDVIQEVDVWMSEHDIQAGARWLQSLSTTLSQCNIGVACLTPENLLSPWLLFEAGAISKSVSDGRFIPLILDLEPAQVKSPLSQFQLVKADRAGFAKIVESLNSVAVAPISADRLARQVDRCWTELSERIDDALRADSDTKKPAERSDRDILEEILGLSRAAVRNGPTAAETPIWIDTSELDPESLPIEIHIKPSDSVSDFLDTVWFKIEKQYKIPAFTYGTQWVLQNQRTGEVLKKIGARYIQSRGRERDSRRIAFLHLEPEDVLVVSDPRKKTG